MTAIEYLIAVAAVIIGAIAQGSVGFGFGMLAAPVLALVDEQLVPGAVLLLGLTVALIVAWDERGALDWLGIRWALVGRVLGTLAGAYAVTRLDHDAMAITLGVLVLVAVAISLTGWHVRPTTSTLVGAGMMSGVMGTFTSVGGPPMALVYQREEAAKLRSTLAGFFVFGASLALLVLTVSGEVGKRQVVDGLLLLPGLLVGVTLSRLLAPYLDRGWTRAGVLALSALTAVALVVGALI
ncbi:MAG TPA: sulfite exporter TauE/SafE family protein [Desertimonas sp.]|nr:sulfite exporter TauE/SafE family protein [Desertimonas sp.]